MLDLVEHRGRAYVLSDEAGRRDYNQAWFEALYIDADDEAGHSTVTRVRRTPLLASLHEHRSAGLTDAVTQEQERRCAVRQRRTPCSGRVPPPGSGQGPDQSP